MHKNIILFILLPFLFLYTSPLSSQETEKAVIFAVRSNLCGGEGSSSTQIDPIAVIESGKYKPAIDYSLPEEAYTQAQKKWISTYYKTGQEYRLLFGGGEKGKVITGSYRASEMGCDATEVNLVSELKIQGQVMALATNSKKLGKSAGSRRALTAEEREKAVALAKGIFQGKKLTTSQIDQMEAINLTAVDLNGDSQWEWIGSFQTPRKTKNLDGANPNIFLISEFKNGETKIAFQKFNPENPENQPDGIDFRERLVDILDLDGDGISEVISDVTGYESWSYRVYKKTGEGWKKVYEGGGGGV